MSIKIRQIEFLKNMFPDFKYEKSECELEDDSITLNNYLHIQINEYNSDYLLWEHNGNGYKLLKREDKVSSLKA